MLNVLDTALREEALSRVQRTLDYARRFNGIVTGSVSVLFLKGLPRVPKDGDIYILGTIKNACKILESVPLEGEIKEADILKMNSSLAAENPVFNVHIRFRDGFTLEITVGHMRALDEVELIEKDGIRFLCERNSYLKYKIYKMKKGRARITDVLDLFYLFGEDEALRVLKEHGNRSILSDLDTYMKFIPPENIPEAEKIIAKLGEILLE